MKQVEKTVLQDLGRKLRYFRRQRGITQAELAQHIGTKQDLISKYERGARAIGVIDLVIVAKVLEVPISVLLGYESAEDPLYLFFKQLFPPLREALTNQILEYIELQNRVLGEIVKERNFVTIEDPILMDSDDYEALPGSQRFIVVSEEEKTEFVELVNQRLREYLSR